MYKLKKPDKIYQDDYNHENLNEMARVNKLTEGVFTEIVGSTTEISKIKRFQYVTPLDGKELKGYLKEYKEITEKINNDLNQLSLLERIILQKRAKNSMDIKLSILREYIYARTPFYRDDKSTKDIRVIVDKTEFSGEDTDKLMGTNDFMDKAKTKLWSAMDEEISNSIIEYEKFKLNQ